MIEIFEEVDLIKNHLTVSPVSESSFDKSVIEGLIREVASSIQAMLEPDEEERWLQADDPDELQALLDPFPDGLTDAYEISTRVNDPANDSAEVIEPIGHGQFGLGQFS